MALLKNLTLLRCVSFVSLVLAAKCNNKYIRCVANANTKYYPANEFAETQDLDYSHYQKKISNLEDNSIKVNTYNELAPRFESISTWNNMNSNSNPRPQFNTSSKNNNKDAINSTKNSKNKDTIEMFSYSESSSENMYNSDSANEFGFTYDTNENFDDIDMTNPTISGKGDFEFINGNEEEFTPIYTRHGYYTPKSQIDGFITSDIDFPSRNPDTQSEIYHFAYNSPVPRYFNGVNRNIRR